MAQLFSHRNFVADQDDDVAKVHGDIARYYTAKIQTHGPCARGVDWPCAPSQELRFVQLLKLCDPSQPFSLNDFGCGYGALCGFLDKRLGGVEIDYLGVDLSPEMVRQARRLWAHKHQTSFAVGAILPRVADYSLASGVFNVKLHQPHARWMQLIKQTLRMLSASSRLGFAVNFLTPMTDSRGQVDELYRTAGGVWLAYCKRTLGLKVEVVGSYGMNELTLVVRRHAGDTGHLDHL